MSPGPTTGCRVVVSKKKWKAALTANTRRTVADGDREDNGWILVGRKENSRDILTYERPEYIVQREQQTCDKKW